MINFFNAILSMSVSASILILAVLVIRALLKKAPKWTILLLWCLVALRLICPFSIKNPYSIQPKHEVILYNVVNTDGSKEEITIPHQLPAPIIEDTTTDNYEAVRFEVPYLYSALSLVWCIGVVIMLFYAVMSYIKLYILTRKAVKNDKGFYCLKQDCPPFVFGIIKPRIYIPDGCKTHILPHIIAHETVHISRLDHIWKPLGFAIVSLHWFNPLVWVAYFMFCRDLESACDEKAIKEMTLNERADYAQALLDCSDGKSFTSVCPVAFGENGVKGRIKDVLNYKKPTLWITAVILLLCVAVAFFFMTEREDKKDESPKNDITVEKIDDFTVINPEKDKAFEDAKYHFPGIEEEAIEYALDLGFNTSAKHYNKQGDIYVISGSSYGYVDKINHAHTEKVKADEEVKLYYMEYYYYANTISPDEDDEKFIYPMFFALHHNLRTDKWTRIGSIYDYQLEKKYNTPEMIDKFGDKFTAATAEMYKDYFHLDMGEKEQMILAAYNSATVAANWFRMASILEQQNEYPSADDLYIELDDRRYFKVKRFDRYDEFIDYLEHLFSEELIQNFLQNESIKYINVDGALYATLGIRGSNIHMGNEYYTIEHTSDSKYVIKVTVEKLGGDDGLTVVGSEVFEFTYEFIGDRWVFTEFPQIR